MSQRPVCGRWTPRWSFAGQAVPPPGVAGSPASSARELASSAWVGVGPPLSRSGPICASLLVMSPVPALSAQALFTTPIRLCPCEVSAPEQSGAAAPLLPAIRLFLRVSVLPAALSRPPLPPLAEFLATVTLLRVAVLAFATPPPVAAVLPLIVLLVSVSAPWLSIPPPLPLAVLPLIVLESSVSVPPLEMPAPAPAALPLTTLCLSVSVPWFRIPPPPPPPASPPW